MHGALGNDEGNDGSNFTQEDTPPPSQDALMAMADLQARMLAVTRDSNQHLQKSSVAGRQETNWNSITMEHGCLLDVKMEEYEKLLLPNLLGVLKLGSRSFCLMVMKSILYSKIQDAVPLECTVPAQPLEVYYIDGAYDGATLATVRGRLRLGVRTLHGRQHLPDEWESRVIVPLAQLLLSCSAMPLEPQFSANRYSDLKSEYGERLTKQLILLPNATSADAFVSWFDAVCLDPLHKLSKALTELTDDPSYTVVMCGEAAVPYSNPRDVPKAMDKQVKQDVEDAVESVLAALTKDARVTKVLTHPKLLEDNPGEVSKQARRRFKNKQVKKIRSLLKKKKEETREAKDDRRLVPAKNVPRGRTG